MDVTKVTKSFRYQHTLNAGKRQRWEDKDGNRVWSKFRIFVCQTVESQIFEMIMGAVILFNLIVVIYEVDQEAACYPLPEGMTIDDCNTRSGSIPEIWRINFSLLIIYSMEAICRLYAERLEYFQSGWNNLDFIVVITGWLAEALRDLPTFSFLRFLRTTRLARMMRMFISFRELYLLMTGLINVTRTIFFSAFMLFSLLTLWSIILVEHAHPINIGLGDLYGDCERCPKAFSSVMKSNLTLFQQIVAGDSWGQVSIPLAERSWLVASIMVGIVITISLGLMNLILAVIVERAQDAREQDKQAKIREKEQAQMEQKLELLQYCKGMDADNSGCIDINELMHAYETMDGFRSLLTLMDIKQEEIKSIFGLLDNDGSGDVSYEEFCEELHNIRTRDTRTMLTFLKLSVTDLTHRIQVTQQEVKDHVEVTLAEHTEALKNIQQTLDKGVRMEGPVRLAEDAPPAETQAGPVASPGGQASGPGLLEFLGKDTRAIASLKSGIVSRVEAQVETLLHHSDWLSNMGYAMQPLDSSKMQRVEEKIGRLRVNVADVEKQLESSAAALARNTELLSGLSKEIDYQPKAGSQAQQQMKASFDEQKQRGLMMSPDQMASPKSPGHPSPSPRVGQAPQKPVPRGGDQVQDLEDQVMARIDRAQARRSSSGSRRSEERGSPLMCACTDMESGSRKSTIARPPEMSPSQRERFMR